MMQEINLIIPVLSPYAAINKISEDNYIVAETNLSYQLKVNYSVASIIKLVDGQKNIEEICGIVNLDNGSSFDVDSVYCLLFDRMAKYGIILQDDFAVKMRGKPDYLKLSIELIPQKVTNIIVKPLTFLFNRYLFSSLVLLLPVIIGAILIIFQKELREGINSLFSSMFIIYFLLFGVWIMIHELGHAAACKRFQVNPGAIGFGFYLFSPVLYSDVSNIWLLEKKKRIVVNLAGVYLEMIVAAILLMTYCLTRIEILLILPAYLILSTIYNFNPLIKYDGYWILSDLLEISNLHSKAYSTFREFIKSPRCFHSSKTNIFLALYGFISMAFIFVFIITILIFDFDSILYFPYKIFALLMGQLAFEFSILSSLILPFVFYFLVIKYFVVKFPFLLRSVKAFKNRIFDSNN